MTDRSRSCFDMTPWTVQLVGAALLGIGRALMTEDPLQAVLFMTAGLCVYCVTLFYLIVTGRRAVATLLVVVLLPALVVLLFLA